MNVSRVYAEFYVRVFVWIEEAGGKNLIPDAVVDNFYQGKVPMVLSWGEIVQGHFFLNLKEWLGISSTEGIRDREKVARRLSGDKLHLEISVEYRQEKKRKTPIYYDHYYARLSNEMHVVRADNAIIPGEWVFGGRNKTPVHPDSTTEGGF